MEKSKREILETEKSFSKMLSEKGFAEAFYHFAAENAVLKRENDTLIWGRKAIFDYYNSKSQDAVKLEWEPDFIDVSECGTMGYTYGKYKLVRNENNKEQSIYGIFHTVWKKQKDGSWKYVWD